MMLGENEINIDIDKAIEDHIEEDELAKKRIIFVDHDIVMDFRLTFVDGQVIVGSEEFDKVVKENPEYYIDLITVHKIEYDCDNPEHHHELEPRYPYMLLKVLKSIDELDHSVAIRTTIINPASVKCIEMMLDDSIEEAQVRKEKEEELAKLK